MVGALIEKTPTPGVVVETEEFEDLGVTRWSLGNGATVLVKPTTEDVAVFAYAPDGRVYLNNFASLGQAAPPPAPFRLDSISDSPYTARTIGVACSVADWTCSYAPVAALHQLVRVLPRAASSGNFRGISEHNPRPMPRKPFDFRLRRRHPAACVTSQSLYDHQVDPVPIIP